MMFGTSKGTLHALALFAFLLVVSPGETARLPRFLCDFYRSLFIDFGCVNRATGLCPLVNRLLTDELFGEPACDYFPCNGYGRNAGTCLDPAVCTVSESNGICNRGEVCCQSTGSSSASSSSASSSSGGSSSNSLAADDAGMDTFAVELEGLPADFADDQ